MKLADYQNALAEIKYGKRLPGALYVHCDQSSDFGADLNRLLAQLAAVTRAQAFLVRGSGL